MLTSDLVLVRRRKGELTLPELNGKSGDEVRHWAEQVLDAAGGCVGLPRQHYASLVKVMGETQQHRKLARGLAKLVEDACDFDEANLEDSAAIRRELFVRATEVRRSSPAEWNRNSIVQQLCAERGWTPDGLEGRLYADLPGAQRLLRVPDWTPEILVDCYDNSRVQAVLLRAVQVRVTYRETTSAQLRELFHQLKFRRLLHHSQRIEPRGLGLTIDGPYSLFESVTKYGLQLALLVTALRDAGDFELDADVLWGADRERLNFRYAYRALGNRGHVERVAEERTEQADELQQLMSDISAISSRFQVVPAATLIDLPGIGICVPDLTFVDTEASARRVHFELLGYWSRASVWKRVELVQAGLSEPVLFGVNQRLRVSEEVLDRDATGALYVFRGRPNAKTLLERVEQLASRKG